MPRNSYDYYIVHDGCLVDLNDYDVYMLTESQAVEVEAIDSDCMDDIAYRFHAINLDNTLKDAANR